MQSHGKRIAVEDPIAQSQYRIGDTMSFLALRSQVKDPPLLAFTAAGICRARKAARPATTITAIGPASWRR